MSTAELLASGKAFVDLDTWRVVAVTGADSLEWLNDLVSADVSDVAPDRAKHSLLLSRTGAIRAAFTVTVHAESLLLLQDPAQTSIAELLGPYVLSSDVELEDRSDATSVFAIPGRDDPPGVPGAAFSSPSSLWSPGVDLIASREDHDVLSKLLSDVFAQADEDDVEAWRIVRSIPRLGVDVVDGDLPQEARLGAAVSRNKGCYVGQEAIAKLDNLGRPRRVLVPFTAEGTVPAGDIVLAHGDEVGRVTSAVTIDGETRGLARVKAAAENGSLTTADGTRLG